jgi:hypothetical protein
LEFHGYGPLDDQGNPVGQNEDHNSDHEDDQVYSQETPQEARTHREKKIVDTLHQRSILLENVLGSVRERVSKGVNYLTLALVMLLSLV